MRLIAICTLVCACSTHGASFVVYVDSLRSTMTSPGISYCIPETPDILEDLERQEYLRYAHAALQLTGFQRRPCLTSDVTITISYTMGEPNVTRWTTSNTSVVVPFRGLYLGRTTVREHERTDYARLLLIEAWSSKAWRASQRRVKVWSTRARSWGYSSDMRRVFPVMLGACLGRLAVSSDREIQVYTYEGHETVRAIKEGRKVSSDSVALWTH